MLVRFYLFLTVRVPKRSFWCQRFDEQVTRGPVDSWLRTRWWKRVCRLWVTQVTFLTVPAITSQQLLDSPDIEDRRRYVCALSEMPHISASVHKLDQWRWLDQVKCHQQDSVGVPAAPVADLPTVSGLGCRSEMEL